MPARRDLTIWIGWMLLATSLSGFAFQQTQKANPAKGKEQRAEEVLTNDSIIQLLKVGLGEDVIITKIQNSKHAFDLSVQGMVALKQGGVSDRLLRYMMNPDNPPQAAAAPAVTPAAKRDIPSEEPAKADVTRAPDRAAPGGKRYTVSGYVGTSSVSAAPRMNVVLFSEDDKKNVDSVQTNFFGKYSFKNVAPGTYLVKAGKVTKEAVVVKSNLRIDIDLSAEDGTMVYGKAQAADTAPSQPAAPSGPNDASLMQAMAAEYYSYSGSTERKVMLCADGRYFNASESSYSGTSSDSLGNQNMAWGSASQKRGEGRWTVQGNQQQGTITLSGNDGSRSQVQYQSTGERGCFRFNGTTFCMSGAPRCQ